MVLPFLAALAPFAPLIGGAIGAVGSFLSAQEANKPKTQTGSIDLMRLRADAEAAGFNPLTIIRGGGLAGYANTTFSGGGFSPFGEALSTFGSGVAAWQYDPYSQQRQAMEFKLAQAQLDNLNASTAALGSRNVFGGGVLSSKPKPASPGTVLQFAGVPFDPPPGWSPSSDVTDQLGEPWEWLYAPFIAGATAIHKLMTPTTGAGRSPLPARVGSGGAPQFGGVLLGGAS